MKYSLQPFLMVLPLLFGLSQGDFVFGGESPGFQRATFSPTGRTPHPPGLPSVWKGRNITELVKSLGEPDIVLETAVRGIVIYGDTPSIMYVYVPGPGNQVYEAYVVEHDTGEILAHHHR